MAHPKMIIRKTIQVGSSTMVSRLLGIVREGLNIRYLGVGALSDAFITAFSIPNMMRAIFAEGALSAAYIPIFVKTLRTKDTHHANALMTASFLVFEGILLILLCLVALWPEAVVRSIAWGFSDEQVAATVPMLRILIFFVFFISSSALFAAALQAVNKFMIPALGQILINGCIVSGLLICIWLKLPIVYLCLFILLGGFLHVLLHMTAYFKAGFGFAPITRETWRDFARLLWAFITCALSTSVAELDYFVDRAFASYLPQGSISLVFYANRFMAIPLGVFATAFSTILITHFSRVSTYAPKRLSYYLLESTKLVFWVMLPVTFFMCFFAKEIMSTLFIFSAISDVYVHEASMILIAFVLGLFFFSLNKIVLNMYYALHATLLPLVVAVVAVASNIFFNYVLIGPFGAAGLALSTSISGCIQTVCLITILRYWFDFTFYGKPFMSFMRAYIVQLGITLSSFLGIYYGIVWLIKQYASAGAALFLLKGFGVWFWIGPLCLLTFFLLLYMRKIFNISLHFITW